MRRRISSGGDSALDGQFGGRGTGQLPARGLDHLRRPPEDATGEVVLTNAPAVGMPASSNSEQVVLE
jgi:hypothetical protein